jgi:hypothetical protein
MSDQHRGRGRPAGPTRRVEVIRATCGHSVPYRATHGDRFDAERRAKIAGRACRACREAAAEAEAAEAKATAARRVAAVAAARTGQLPPEVPGREAARYLPMGTWLKLATTDDGGWRGQIYGRGIDVEATAAGLIALVTKLVRGWFAAAGVKVRKGG